MMHLAAQPVARSSRLSMSVTVGHIKVPDVTLCSTVCRGSSPPCALVCPGRMCAHMCSCVLEEFARICALDTIELTLSQYPTVRQCSVREGGTRFFLCSCNKREDALEATMSVTVGHIKVPDVTLPRCNQGILRAPPMICP